MQATNRPRSSLLAGPHLTAYSHPWFNGRSVFHHSCAFEGRQEVYLGSGGGGGGAGELHRPKLKINGEKHPYISNVSPHRRTNCKGNVKYMHIFNTSPHRREKVSYIFNTSPHRWTKRAIHLRPGGPNVDKGSHTCSMHLRVGGPAMKNRTYNQCIFAPYGPMWTAIKSHTYIQICPHQLITEQHEFHK